LQGTADELEEFLRSQNKKKSTYSPQEAFDEAKRRLIASGVNVEQQLANPEQKGLMVYRLQKLAHKIEELEENPLGNSKSARKKALQKWVASKKKDLLVYKKELTELLFKHFADSQSRLEIESIHTGKTIQLTAENLEVFDLNRFAHHPDQGEAVCWIKLISNSDNKLVSHGLYEEETIDYRQLIWRMASALVDTPDLVMGIGSIGDLAPYTFYLLHQLGITYESIEFLNHSAAVQADEMLLAWKDFQSELYAHGTTKLPINHSFYNGTNLDRLILGKWLEDPNYWAERERKAIAKNLPQSNLIKRLAQASRESRRNFEARLNSPGITNISADMNFAKNSNTSRSELEKAEKIKLFNISKSFYGFIFLPQKADMIGKPVTLSLGTQPKNSHSLQITSAGSIDFSSQTIPIIEPEGYKAVHIEITDNNGRKFEPEKDFRAISYTKTGSSFIVFPLTKDLYPDQINLRLFYTPKLSTNKKRTKPIRIPNEKIKYLATEVEKAGGTVLADTLRLLADSSLGSVRIREVKGAFVDSARYSYLPEGRVKSVRSIFSEFSPFFSKDGLLCAQCDTTNLFFNKTLDTLLTSEQMQELNIRLQVGFLMHGHREITQARQHMRNHALNAKDLRLDVTPSKQDLRKMEEAIDDRFGSLGNLTSSNKLTAIEQDPILENVEDLKKQRMNLEKAIKIGKYRKISDGDPTRQIFRISETLTGYVDGKIDLREAAIQIDPKISKENQPTPKEEYVLNTLIERLQELEMRVADYSTNPKVKRRAHLDDPIVKTYLLQIIESSLDLTENLVNVCQDLAKRL